MRATAARRRACARTAPGRQPSPAAASVRGSLYQPLTSLITRTGITCAAVTGYQNADWPLTNSGDSAAGTCVAGYSGSPARACSIEGVWSSTVNPTCIRTFWRAVRARHLTLARKPVRGGDRQQRCLAGQHAFADVGFRDVRSRLHGLAYPRLQCQRLVGRHLEPVHTYARR